MLTALFGFTIAIIPIVVTPGASFTIMATHVLNAERGVVRRVAAGTGFGILSHATFAALGLSAIVMQSAQLYRLVQLAGAVYLVALGITTIMRHGGPKATVDETTPSAPRLRTHTAYLANLLNPKAAAVYLTLVPQFLDHESFTLVNVLALASAHAALTAGWLTVSAGALRSLRRRRLRFPRRAFGTVGGAVLIALGIRTLMQPRTV